MSPNCKHNHWMHAEVSECTTSMTTNTRVRPCRRPRIGERLFQPIKKVHLPLQRLAMCGSSFGIHVVAVDREDGTPIGDTVGLVVGSVVGASVGEHVGECKVDAKWHLCRHRRLKARPDSLSVLSSACLWAHSTKVQRMRCRSHCGHTQSTLGHRPRSVVGRRVVGESVGDGLGSRLRMLCESTLERQSSNRRCAHSKCKLVSLRILRRNR